MVTGASGFLGGHIVQVLLSRGYHVVAPIRRPIGHSLSNPEMLVLDLLGEDALDELRRCSVQSIIHCAAVIPRSQVGEESNRSAQLNRRMDDLMVRFAAETKARLVFTSSTAVYGLVSGYHREDAPKSPAGSYACGKLETEEKASDRLGKDFISLRICAPYGPGQRTRTVMQIFIEAALAGRDLRYFGSGGRMQTFTAAEDVASAAFLAVRNLEACGVYNIVGQSPISMKELAELVVEIVNDSPSRVTAAGKPDPQEGFRAIFPIDRAAVDLGWTPRVALEDGIRSWVEILKADAQ